MGTVWRARDVVLHRLVAVKEVRPPDRDLAEYDPEGARMLRERVLREARALARIDHPNVVTIHHIVDGGEGTYPWLVMELVSGGSLADRLAKGPMPTDEAARTGRGVLAALTAAHDAGIQHRDVKPANVLLRPDGRPVLTDFGIAAIREATGLTATGSIIGTPDFMAPERISGHEGGAASDLWSLAMMLYTAVEGHHPLRRASTLATLAAVLHDDVPPPVRAGALGPVLMGVLVRDPAARPSTAVLDRQLAAIESAPPAQPTAERHQPTSYPLAPPSPASAPRTTAPVPPAHRRVPGLTALLGVSGTTLTAALLWWLLPFGGDSGDAASGAPTSTSSPGSSASQTIAAPDAEQSGGTESASLLTPDGVRTAIKALKEKSGRNRFGSFLAYPDSVTASMMVNGSDTKYDEYSYHPGEGVEKGTSAGTLSTSEQPVDLDIFNWDRLPVLLAEADKKLNVDDPEYRYLSLRLPDTSRDTPAEIAVYLSDEYGAGFLEADTQGRVTDVSPAKD